MNEKLKEALSGIDQHIWTSEEEVGILLSSLIKLSKYKNVLESGVFKGQTSCYLIDALPEDGKYTGIDPYEYRCDSVKKFMENHNFIQGSSLEELPKLESKSFDLIFIDSVHEFDYLEKEFRLCERLIKFGGIIALHDSHLEGVKKWIDYIKHFPCFQIINLDTCDSWGNNRGVCLIKCLI